MDFILGPARQLYKYVPREYSGHSSSGHGSSCYTYRTWDPAFQLPDSVTLRDRALAMPAFARTPAAVSNTSKPKEEEEEEEEECSAPSANPTIGLQRALIE